MDQTPRPRSGAFPSTPATSRRGGQQRPQQQTYNPQQPPRFSSLSSSTATSPGLRRSTQSSVADISMLKATPTEAQNDPLIPERILDAPSQRLFVVSFWVLLCTWRFIDFYNLQDAEEQSLWLFMKWVAIDGVFLFGLPGLKIPWLEWSSATMLMLFSAHAVVDAMLMFRISIPITAGFAALGRSVWGAYEMALNEHNVNPDSIRFNESLILGRYVINILPEGSAILNPQRESYCIDDSRTEARLPITINSTSPISIELLRIDLETQANETIYLGKSQIKAMHKEAARMISYSDKPGEPKTLYHTVNKPGLYLLQKVVDETNLEVSRKRLAHTVVVPCPKAKVLPSASNRCRGELSNINIEVAGTPPLKVKYRKMVNQVTQDATFERIQPEEFFSPLSRQDSNAVALPHRVDVEWAKPQTVSVPLSESLGSAGKWVYSIQEVTDGFGNTVSYSSRDHDRSEHAQHSPKSSHLHQVIKVHERPQVNLRGCSPQQPLKVAKGQATHLPVHWSSTGKNELADASHTLEYLFTPYESLGATNEHTNAAQKQKVTLKNTREAPVINAAGLYTLTGVSTEFCAGEVLEPATCLLQNPPHPQVSISNEEIFDKCAGSPIGLRVGFDFIGTPPFEVRYQVTKSGDRFHTSEIERFAASRGQIEFTPHQAGHYTYEFIDVSDAVYKSMPLKGLSLEQNVKPSASARIVDGARARAVCIDEAVSFNVALQGEGPFSLEYEIIHNGKRTQHKLDKVENDSVSIQTQNLKDGGDYLLALTSIRDRNGCKEFLKDEARITVRHQKPKVSFGHIEGQRKLSILEGKKVQLPLRLSGEAPWTIRYKDQSGREHEMRASQPNDVIAVLEQGSYQLLSLRDSSCPGVVDEAANAFEIGWIGRPDLRIAPNDNMKQDGNILERREVCEGDDDAFEVLFKGAAPYHAHYVQEVKADHGAIAPKQRELRSAAQVATLRLDTGYPGVYEYRFTKMADANYEHSAKHFTPITVRQRVNAKPSAAFANPGKTYGFCSIESEGEEVIPVVLHGQPPFSLEVEIKHHGPRRPETITLTDITEHKHDIRIPRSRLHLGKSAVSLRRVSDSRGCARLLDSTVPRVQISVHDAPTITPLEAHSDFCPGERLNFALSGVAPFTIHYTFAGSPRKAVASAGTFRRLADKPGDFVITGIEDSASSCKANVNITRSVHPMPWAQISQGKESHIDIHEGGEAELVFSFGGTPPFEFTYTRSAAVVKGKASSSGGKAAMAAAKPGAVLDMRSEVAEGYEMRVLANQEGVYEVVAIKDRYCAYAKPGVKVGSPGGGKGQKLLMG